MFQAEVNKLVGSQFCDNVLPATMRIKLERAGEAAELCERQIKKARKEKGGKLTIKKHGVIIDENGHRVEAFAFEIGRFVINRTLYTGIAVDMLTEDVHVLLIRSDVKKGAYELFPDIGTAHDWRVLRKCADRFSPKSASHRYTINTQAAHDIALETAAVKCLEQSGTFQQCDLTVFQGMDTAKLHLIDLGAVIALENAFPRHLLPRMVNVILTRDADDLEEVHRVFKALDFATGAQAPGLYVPAVCIRGKNSLDIGMRQPALIRGPSNRPEIRQNIVEIGSELTCKQQDLVEKERFRRLKMAIKQHRKKGDAAIVYCNTVKQTKQIASNLEAKGFRAAMFFADMPAKAKSMVLNDFQSENPPIVVATSAFGMGIDKANVRLIVHMSMPLSMEDYWQKTGRAGRDGKKSHSYLFWHHGDYQTNRKIIAKNKKNLAKLQQLWKFLHSSVCCVQELRLYFGEDMGKKCGRCSRCRQMK